MSYANLIFKRIPFAALISDRGDWSSPLGWEKKIFGWIADRRAIPAEKGEHIRMPYSAAKIVSISPGAMPPFTLETHTINAKLNLPSRSNSLHQAPALGLYFTSKNLPMGGWEGRARVSSHSSRYTKRSRVFWSPKLDLSPFSPFLVPHLQASTPPIQKGSS